MQPILEAAGLRRGRDFFLAFSPEREDPGNPRFRAPPTIPKVVGGDGPSAARASPPPSMTARGHDRAGLLGRHGRGGEADREHLPCRQHRPGERAEGQVFAAMGIDVWEVIDAAKTKPFGYMPFYPGPGLGGHCIPIDPFYLTWRAQRIRPLDPLHRACRRDQHAPCRDWVVDRLAEALDRRSAAASTAAAS